MKNLAKILVVLAAFFLGFYFGFSFNSWRPLANQVFVNEPTAAAGDSQSELTNSGVPAVDSSKAGLAPGENSASLFFDFGNGELKNFKNIPIDGETTVFSLLKKITAENNLEFKYQDYGGDLGVFVKSINNLANNAVSDYWWQYWVNGRYAAIGASNYLIKPGDVVEWKYALGTINN